MKEYQIQRLISFRSVSYMTSLYTKDIAFAESRIRIETIAAEDILHDLGAISIVSSDSQAMGRIGEVITRTWQTAGFCLVFFRYFEILTFQFSFF